MQVSKNKTTNNDGCLRESMQVDIKIRSSPQDFFDQNVRFPEQYPEAVPTQYKKVRVIQGKAGRVGSVIRYKFVDGSTSVERLSVVDYKRKFAVFDELQGYLAETYNNFQYKLYCFPKCEGSLVRWILSYEKKKQDDPEPTTTLADTVEFTHLMDNFNVNQRANN
ncbi:hypothetical protein ACFE04_029452 [Oxalis oulophora]